MDDVTGRLRRWAVPAVPFAFSLLLSLPTTSSTVFWQDSGFYLTVIHEMAVPAPHGFMLYLLLAKAWTLVVAPLAGFTLAVHLFSAFCAAGAAAFLADGARAFLKRTWPDGPCDGPAIAARSAPASRSSRFRNARAARAVKDAAPAAQSAEKRWTAAVKPKSGAARKLQALQSAR